jgi:broad specificity phosphatase PhoE
VQRFFAEHPFNDDDHILIVGHFSLNKALIFQLLGWPLNRWEEVSQDNTCVNSIEKNGEQLVHYSLNCTRHLTA